MRRGASLAFPPFTRAVKMLIGINVAVYFLLLLLNISGQNQGFAALYRTFGLVPMDVIHGRIWELVTYSFLHAGIFHILFNMLTLWMFGATLEAYWGRRQFLEFYFFSVVGAALCTVIVAYAANGVLGLAPRTLTVGASGGIYGLLLAFGYLFGEQEIFLIFPPIGIKAKYMVGILILIALAGAMGVVGGTANVAHLGGALFGFLYLKFMPRKGLSLGLSESYYDLRNSYHKWKRRRAAKKFQVYMRKHQHDPKQYFDEYGNFKPPDDGEKKDQGGWIN